MYLLKYEDLSYSNLAMTNENVSYPRANILTEYTQETTVSTTNSTTISFDVAELTDVDIYNAGAIDSSGNIKELVSGTVTLKDKATGSTIVSEVMDFYTASSIAYMGTNDLTYHRNIRAFHGEQIFWTDVNYPQGYTVEIYLEADAGDFVEVGIVACGIFVKYGDTIMPSISKTMVSFSGNALIAEYNNIMAQTDSETEFFFHTNTYKFDGENLTMAFGIPEIKNQKYVADPSQTEYKIEFKV